MTFLFLLQLDEFDAYIIVSFVNATLVLSIGETVEEVTDSGFLGTTPTLSCSLLGDDALVQVRISCLCEGGVCLSMAFLSRLLGNFSWSVQRLSGHAFGCGAVVLARKLFSSQPP